MRSEDMNSNMDQVSSLGHYFGHVSTATVIGFTNLESINTLAKRGLD